MNKTLACKRCGEQVDVPERQLSVVCQDCAEKNLAVKELEEEEHETSFLFAERFRARLLADAGFRKGYLHQRAIQKTK